MASHLHCNNHIFWQADLTRTYTVPKRARDATRQHGVKNGLEVKKMDSGYLGNHYIALELALSEKRKLSTSPELAAVKTPRIDEEPPQAIEELPKVIINSPKPPIEAPRPDLKASPLQILKFLLSDACLQICHPSSSDPTDTTFTTYNQLLTPYEELLCAVILSHPIPHTLGLLIIRTLLSPPYEFRNPVAMKTAGSKKILEALESARAQHKETSSVELGALADALSNNEWHNDLSKLRALRRNAPESEREALRRSIKGQGKDGLDTFYRRVQWQWDEVYPSIDARAQLVLTKLGLPKRAEGLERMIEVRWGQVGFEDWSYEFNLNQRRMRAFVMVLERAILADLEGRIEEVVEEAAKLYNIYNL
jgi:hypothetical protein